MRLKVNAWSAPQSSDGNHKYLLTRRVILSPNTAGLAIICKLISFKITQAENRIKDSATEKRARLQSANTGEELTSRLQILINALKNSPKIILKNGYIEIKV